MKRRSNKRNCLKEETDKMTRIIYACYTGLIVAGILFIIYILANTLG